MDRSPSAIDDACGKGELNRNETFERGKGREGRGGEVVGGDQKSRTFKNTSSCPVDAQCSAQLAASNPIGQNARQSALRDCNVFPRPRPLCEFYP